MTGAVDAYVGIGSNLDGPADRVRAAIDALAALPATALAGASSLYGSTPMGPAEQPDYVNAVVHLVTRLSPHALLDALQDLERASGRERTGARWGPRVLDLDIILLGDRRIADDRLTVPHPGAGERAFVLLPLAELAPELEIPGLGRVDACARQVGRNGTWRLEDRGA